ncbi:MAG: DDE-type integrase/transposase/recombinase [Candidatus Helarchaeota archaeon]
MSKKFFQTITITVNEIATRVEIPIFCPNSSRGCKSENLVRNGHDTSVKASPQYFYCKDCNISFYAHTSAFFQEVELHLQDFFFRFFRNGRFDKEALKSSLNCSDAALSRIFQAIMNAVNGSKSLCQIWTSPKTAIALFVDETWINIDRRKFYLVVVVNDKKEVLAWDLVKRHTKDQILNIVKRAEARLGHQILILVTDDFSTYKGVATGLGYDLVHVRHVHKPPYGRICIDLIRHGKKSVKTTHVATTNDIFVNQNTFLVRVSESEKVKHEKGKRGRKKGGKNRAKKEIEAEKKAKKKPKKRGPKDPFKDATTHVYHYCSEKGMIGVYGNSNREVAEILEHLACVFDGKFVTTNLIEQEFSILKKLIDFRGKRTRSGWISTINFFFTIRANPQILKDALSGLKICPQVLHRLPLGGCLLPAMANQFVSKGFKAVMASL